MAAPIHAVLVAHLHSDQSQTADCVDVCIVGAGVVGLALARALASVLPERDIVLLEQHGQVGMETSSHNSEVIHAGIYYAPGSLKALCCVQGRELLYDYCHSMDIPFRRIGKLIVANFDEQYRLEEILACARLNGVNSLQLLDAAQIRAMEPNVQADLALWSPDTGIIDSHSYMQHLLREAQAKGMMLAFNTSLAHTSIKPGSGGFDLTLQSAGQTIKLESRVLINCAGLHAAHVARTIEGLPSSHVPQIQFLKGNYLRLSGKSPFSHLIYPVPDPAHRGLGIHATLDLGGQCRFGPDIEPVTSLDLAVDSSRIPLFSREIKRYFPGLNEDKLSVDYAGIRPRLLTNDGSAADFMIQNASIHAIPGLWQLFGIESPGLTASLALAELVARQIKDSAII
ncbi:MAG: NAD(P)/FAD-dependent oxidoreductase [Pseudohongiella sp.]|nr:NAD(P)/FAD-dependent oxidoreductase [Pseudohongiella sp.]